jgi:uncharacterized glyoxalase superfamily protein PhnB
MSVGMWCSMAFRDAEQMMGWLRAVGFQERAVYRDEQDPGVVVHAELLWPGGGGVMCSTFVDRADWPVQPGAAAAYLVCDDCDDVFARAVAAGASVLREPADQDYGGRAAAVRDPEGNVWSMGTYPGE